MEIIIEDCQLLNEHTALALMTQFHKSENYYFYQVDNTKFHVRRYAVNPNIFPDSPPWFDRTRMVRVEETIDGKVV